MKDVPAEANILISSWSMKKKASGVNREILNACGYEQVYGVNCNSSNNSSPLTNDTRIKIVLELTIMAAYTTKIIDVKVSFLHGEFTENEEPIYMKVP